MRNLIIFLATGFYLGYLPVAPGTWGSFLGILTYLFLLPLPTFHYALGMVGIFFLAVWVSGWAETLLSQKDSCVIVIDEVVGILVTMFLLPATWLSILLGFLFFRLFDIMKPAPAGFIDRKAGGGWGIVLDDVVAGIYGNVFVHFILYILNFE